MPDDMPTSTIDVKTLSNEEMLQSLREQAPITFVRLPIITCVLRDHGIDDSIVLDMIVEMLELSEAMVDA